MNINENCNIIISINNIIRFLLFARLYLETNGNPSNSPNDSNFSKNVKNEIIELLKLEGITISKADITNAIQYLYQSGYIDSPSQLNNLTIQGVQWFEKLSITYSKIDEENLNELVSPKLLKYFHISSDSIQTFASLYQLFKDI